MSAYTLTDSQHRPQKFGKHPNLDILNNINTWEIDLCVIEMIDSYGMAVGAEVFETCVWIGRFAERSNAPVQLIKRRLVKLHHCNSPRANDANITQALIDRFAPNTPNRGKGTKAEPGFFYGFKADIWQSYALAVYAADICHDAHTPP